MDGWIPSTSMVLVINSHCLGLQSTRQMISCITNFINNMLTAKFTSELISMKPKLWWGVLSTRSLVSKHIFNYICHVIACCMSSLVTYILNSLCYALRVDLLYSFKLAWEIACSIYLKVFWYFRTPISQKSKLSTVTMFMYFCVGFSTFWLCLTHLIFFNGMATL